MALTRGGDREGAEGLIGRGVIAQPDVVVQVGQVPVHVWRICADPGRIFDDNPAGRVQFDCDRARLIVHQAVNRRGEAHAGIEAPNIASLKGRLHLNDGRARAEQVRDEVGLAEIRSIANERLLGAVATGHVEEMS